MFEAWAAGRALTSCQKRSRGVREEGKKNSSVFLMYSCPLEKKKHLHSAQWRVPPPPWKNPPRWPTESPRPPYFKHPNQQESFVKNESLCLWCQLFGWDPAQNLRAPSGWRGKGGLTGGFNNAGWHGLLEPHPAVDPNTLALGRQNPPAPWPPKSWVDFSFLRLHSTVPPSDLIFHPSHWSHASLSWLLLGKSFVFFFFNEIIVRMKGKKWTDKCLINFQSAMKGTTIKYFYFNKLNEIKIN